MSHVVMMHGVQKIVQEDIQCEGTKEKTVVIACQAERQMQVPMLQCVQKLPLVVIISNFGICM